MTDPHDASVNVPLTPGQLSLGRRDLLRFAGLAAAAAAGGSSLLAGAPAGAAPAAAAPGAVSPAATFSPLRPPATPLAVRSMYLSTWSAADNLAGTWPSFWTGHITAICGIARIDGTPYLFCGAPNVPGVTFTTMTQTALAVTATRSTYTLTGGGVTLTVTFLSPVELGDLQRQSIPFSYVTVTAASSDGASHQVSIYLDISAEWAHGDTSQQVTWAQRTTGATVALTATPASPSVLAEYGDQASWGTQVFAAANRSGLTWQTGQDTVLRAAAANNGALGNTNDTAQPRAINDRWPCFAFNLNLGALAAGATSAPFTLYIGHVRTPAVSYLGTQLNPWWTHYWSDWPAMLDWFAGDRATACSRATALDNKVAADASAAVGGGTLGAHYAGVCALAVRQAAAGTELVDRGGSPWAFLKEISSDGNVSTVDVTYPAFPAYAYLSPNYLQLLLAPILDYAEHGGWPKTFAEHDLGSSYPNAAGHNDGNEEDMPVEESANALIMVAVLLQRLPAAQAAAYAQQHYPILRQWAEYLVANALDPGYQNQTDDFTGFIAHSVNLALKGIVGIGAMGIVSAFAGNSSDRDHYLGVARGYISQWAENAKDSSGSHLRLAYDQDGTWSLKYNGYPDLLLGLDLVPDATAATEASWYQSQAGAYGVLLDPRNDYTKTDWEIWTAAWLANHPVRDTLINGVFNFANVTSGRVPFSDWYVVATAAHQGFQDRPVIGGVLSLLNKRPATLPVTWNKIQNRNSGKVLSVLNMSTANSAEVTQYDDNGTADHLWVVVPNGDGTVRIFNRNSGKLLAVNNQSLDNGAHVQQYVDNGTPDHLWQFIDNGDGWMKIKNVHSGKLLAVDGASTANSAQITQYDDNGTTDHLWRLL
jgi:hypothetical protein